MSSARYVNRNGEPIDDVIEWAKLFENYEYRLVKSTRVLAFVVKTVWNGINEPTCTRPWYTALFHADPLGFVTGSPIQERGADSEADALKDHETLVRSLMLQDKPSGRKR